MKILSRLDTGSHFDHEITLFSTVEHPTLVATTRGEGIRP